MAKKCGIREDCDEEVISNCHFCKNHFCGDGGSRYTIMCNICYRNSEKRKACENSWIGIPLPKNLVDIVPKQHQKNDIAGILTTYLTHIPESSEEKAGGGGGK